MKGHNMMLNQQQQNIQPQICLKSSKYGKKKKKETISDQTSKWQFPDTDANPQ